TADYLLQHCQSGGRARRGGERDWGAHLPGGETRACDRPDADREPPVGRSGDPAELLLSTWSAEAVAASHLSSAIRLSPSLKLQKNSAAPKRLRPSDEHKNAAAQRQH